MSVLLL
jgi:hypothetical protein